MIDDAIYDAVHDEHPVTLRGVYYRVVSTGAVDKTEAGYRLVGRQLLKLRRSGDVPYSWITDGTRLIRKPASWGSLEDMLDDAAVSYRHALWHDQDVEVMVLSEKDAISGAIFPVTARWDVELGIVRGYSSETFAHAVAESVMGTDKPVFIYQLGDHDPSGLDAWRSFTERIRGFAPEADVTFERLAVTEAQIIEMNLLTRPTKTTDSRVKNFTGESVEVDAIKAPILREIVETAITRHIDAHALHLTRVAEDSSGPSCAGWQVSNDNHGRARRHPATPSPRGIPAVASARRGTGRRDPLDPVPQDRAWRVVSIRTHADGAVALIRGWPAREILETLAVPWEWSESMRGHVIDARHVPDVMALAEHRRLIVNFRDEATS